MHPVFTKILDKNSWDTCTNCTLFSHPSALSPSHPSPTFQCCISVNATSKPRHICWLITTLVRGVGVLSVPDLLAKIVDQKCCFLFLSHKKHAPPTQKIGLLPTCMKICLVLLFPHCLLSDVTMNKEMKM